LLWFIWDSINFSHCQTLPIPGMGRLNGCELKKNLQRHHRKGVQF
jgi:hypothetical protein